MDRQPIASRVAELDRAWNNQDVPGVLDFFAEDAVLRITPAPPPPQAEVYTGREQIQLLVQRLINAQAQVESSGARLNGDNASWRFRASGDGIRQLGVGAIEGAAEAVLDDNRFSLLVVTLDPESATAIQPGR